MDILRKQPLARALTQRERDILHPLSQALPNRQIAQRLGLAESTVGEYVSRLLQKFGARNQTELAVAWREVQHRRRVHRRL